MKKPKRRFFLLFVLTILLALLNHVQISFALGVNTHKAINRHIAQQNVSGFSLNDYLKNQLGMQAGIETYFKYDNLTQEVFKWIGDGGVKEDAGARSVNHFHNPITNQGLLSNYSALTWATLPESAQNLTPLSSWNDVRSYYLKALTSTDKTTRDDYFARTFQGVGQVMHLVQDMSVPAHTRDDKHPSFLSIGGDGYENWAKIKINTVDKVGGYSSYSNYTPYDSSAFLIPQLFDSGQYPHINPVPGITTSNSIGLAEYTNANFLSADTIFKNFTYPDWSNLQEYTEDTAPGKTAIYQSKTGDGLYIKHFVRKKIYYDKLPSSDAFRGLRLDDNVHKDYAEFLIPRAIGYSSQVLSYFFRGKLEVEMGEGNLKVKNASTETIVGGIADNKFELYYDNADGVRTLITSAQADTLASGAEQTITFSSPENALSYMLVYKGQFGNESNAVIGKFIPPELVVITVALNGLTGENLTKKSAFVWNPASNSLEHAPSDYENSSFQEWYKARTNIGENMFSDFATDSPAPYRLNPELISTNTIEYHCIPKIIDTHLATIFPESLYATRLPVSSPPAYHGLRTERHTTSTLKRFERFGLWGHNGDGPIEVHYYDFDINDIPTGPNPLSGWDWCVAQMEAMFPYEHMIVNGFYDVSKSSTINEYKFISPLGEFAGFTETDNIEGVAGSILMSLLENKHMIPEWATAHYDVASWNQDWSQEKWTVLTKARYSSHLAGRFSPRSIANIWMIQYTPCNYTSTGTEDYPMFNTVEAWTFYERVVEVSAQAIFRSGREAGLDWVAKGRNNAFETQIKAAIEMAYTLNNIPANEIREVSMETLIVK